MDSTTIQHVARLARIKLTGKEDDKFKEELSSVLDYISQLNKVNTDKVEPFYQTTGLINSTREDKYREDFKVGEELNKKLVGQAPEKQDNFVKVRSVLQR